MSGTIAAHPTHAFRCACACKPALLSRCYFVRVDYSRWGFADSYPLSTQAHGNGARGSSLTRKRPVGIPRMVGRVHEYV